MPACQARCGLLSEKEFVDSLPMRSRNNRFKVLPAKEFYTLAREVNNQPTSGVDGKTALQARCVIFIFPRFQLLCHSSILPEKTLNSFRLRLVSRRLRAQAELVGMKVKRAADWRWGEQVPRFWLILANELFCENCLLSLVHWLSAPVETIKLR